MDASQENPFALIRIKLLHTAIWVFFVIVIGYVVYAGICDVRGPLVWAAVILVIMEGVILKLNDGKCPLTSIAAQYTDRREDNFDIYLPNWLAKYNKRIFTTVFAAGFILVLIRAFG